MKYSFKKLYELLKTKLAIFPSISYICPICHALHVRNKGVQQLI